MAVRPTPGQIIKRAVFAVVFVVVCAVPAVFLLTFLRGCFDPNIPVKVTNRSSKHLSSVTVIMADSEGTGSNIRPGETVSISMLPPDRDTDVIVSVIAADGTSIETNQGYAHHSTAWCVVVIGDGEAGSIKFVAVDAR